MKKLSELSQRFGLSDTPEFAEVVTRFAGDAAAREFLEALIWPSGPFCPHCGSDHVWRHKKAVRYKRHARLRHKTSRSSRPGVLECADCFRQFTVTTRTPLHGTKLPLRKWIAAMYLVLTSSKGVSARLLGVHQETAWKMGHAIRELMDTRNETAPVLSGQVEVDVKRIGGAPRFAKHVWHPPGKGTTKTPVVIAVERGGQVRAAVVAGESAADLRPHMTAVIDPSAHIMSDGDKATASVAKGFARHDAVNHSTKEFVRKERIKGKKVKVHSNTADAFGSQLERAKIGVYHRLSEKHLQRYVNEVAFRWNHRHSETIVTTNGEQKQVMQMDPLADQLAELLKHAVGRQIRMRRKEGLWWPSPISAGFRPPPPNTVAG